MKAWSAAGVLWAILAAAPAGASDNLWGAPPAQSSSPGTAARDVGAGASSHGVAIGSYVTFQGVGTVFYAGRSGGDVYFSDVEEPGVFDWEGALAACGRKGPGWSLPTADQVTLLYTNGDEIDLVAKDVRNTQSYWYWSSSSDDREYALRVRPFDGLQQHIKKKFAARVRCVRVY
jgi:predicted small lipoprotein YifL